MGNSIRRLTRSHTGCYNIDGKTFGKKLSKFCQQFLANSKSKTAGFSSRKLNQVLALDLCVFDLFICAHPGRTAETPQVILDLVLTGFHYLGHHKISRKQNKSHVKICSIITSGFRRHHALYVFIYTATLWHFPGGTDEVINLLMDLAGSASFYTCYM